MICCDVEAVTTARVAAPAATGELRHAPCNERRELRKQLFNTWRLCVSDRLFRRRNGLSGNKHIAQKSIVTEALFVDQKINVFIHYTPPCSNVKKILHCKTQDKLEL